MLVFPTTICKKNFVSFSDTFCQNFIYVFTNQKNPFSIALMILNKNHDILSAKYGNIKEDKKKIISVSLKSYAREFRQSDKVLNFSAKWPTKLLVVLKQNIFLTSHILVTSSSTPNKTSYGPFGYFFACLTHSHQISVETFPKGIHVKFYFLAKNDIMSRN